MALSLIIQRRLTPQIGGLICSGIPGRFAPEWVADLKRNQWPFWCGILTVGPGYPEKSPMRPSGIRFSSCVKVSQKTSE